MSDSKLRAAAQRGLEYAEQVLIERQHALKGYPHKWRVEQEDVDFIREALAAAPAPAPVAQPDGWLRAIDEAMVCAHLGVADAADTYEQAKAKLNTLLCHSQDIGAYFAAEKAQPLTEEQIAAIPCTDGDGSDWDALVRFARAIERAHGIGAQEQR